MKTLDIERVLWEYGGIKARERKKAMRQNRQSDFSRGLSDNGNQWRQSWSAGYNDKHSEPGDVYIMIGLLSRFRVKAKIGLSRNPKRRLRELRDDYGAFVFPVFIISTNNMSRLEKSAHHAFKRYNSPESFGTGRSEWFEINPIRMVRMIGFLFCKEKFFQYGDRLQSMRNRL